MNRFIIMIILLCSKLGKPFLLASKKTSAKFGRISNNRNKILSLSSEAQIAERIVTQYFQGVNETDANKIGECFDIEKGAEIRDICALNSSTRKVKRQDLVNRCMEFLAAHPDCNVDFHFAPKVIEEHDDHCWVLAHWYETGTWSGESCGLQPNFKEMAVEGQTRFRVDSATKKIDALVVTRTFTDWEQALQLQNQKESEADWEKDLTLSQLQDMLKIAETAARAAGDIILSNQGCCSIDTQNCEIKTNIKDIITEYDAAAQEQVEQTILSAYPHHSFLGEENVDPGAAASEQALEKALKSTPSGFLWICDPIDGTANFASGLSISAVTLGLVYKGIPLIGIVYDPHADEMFSAIRGQGAFCNKERLSVSTSITDASEAIVNAGCPADPNAFQTSMRGVLALNKKTRGIRIIACSALTTSWIAAGRLTAHFGYDLSSWDLVAGALLIQEAGGLVTDLDGTPYSLTTRNMLCSNGLIHSQILNVLKEADAISFTRSG